MINQESEVDSAIARMRSVVERAFCTYYDVGYAMANLRDRTVRQLQQANIEIGVSINDQLKGRFIYVDGFPDEQVGRVMASGTTKDYLERLSIQSATGNYRAIADMTFVYIYSEWERVRSEIARLLKVDVGQVTCDVMGDMRLLRNCVLHAGSVFDKSIDRLKVLKWADKGDVIALSDDLMNSLNNALLEAEINVLGKSWALFDSSYRRRRDFFFEVGDLAFQTPGRVFLD